MGIDMRVSVMTAAIRKLQCDPIQRIGLPYSPKKTYRIQTSNTLWRAAVRLVQPITEEKNVICNILVSQFSQSHFSLYRNVLEAISIYYS